MIHKQKMYEDDKRKQRIREKSDLLLLKETRMRSNEIRNISSQIKKIIKTRGI